MALTPMIAGKPNDRAKMAACELLEPDKEITPNSP